MLYMYSYEVNIFLLKDIPHKENTIMITTLQIRILWQRKLEELNQGDIPNKQKTWVFNTDTLVPASVLLTTPIPLRKENGYLQVKYQIQIVKMQWMDE